MRAPSNDPQPPIVPDPSAPADADARVTSTLAARLGGVLPALRRATDWLRYLSVAAAAAAVAVWVAFFVEGAWGSAPRTVASGAALLILLVPPTITLVAAWTLRDVLSLPDRLRGLSARAAAAVPPAGGRIGLVRALWVLRGVLAEARGSALRVGAVARAARLGSIAAVAALALAVVLNVVLILAAGAVLAFRMLGGV